MFRPDIVLLHGTTVGTNTLLQRKGARVAFVTTAGFRRHHRNRPPESAQALRPDVRARAAAGRARHALRRSRSGSLPTARFCSGHRRTIFACSLATFMPAAPKPSPSQRYSPLPIQKRTRHRPRAGRTRTAACRCRISSCPSFASTNAPAQWWSTLTCNRSCRRYLHRLDARMPPRLGEDQITTVFVMQSSGGITSLESAARQPVRTVLSGPAGGVVGAVADGPAQRIRARDYF